MEGLMVWLSRMPTSTLAKLFLKLKISSLLRILKCSGFPKTKPANSTANTKASPSSRLSSISWLLTTQSAWNSLLKIPSRSGERSLDLPILSKPNNKLPNQSEPNTVKTAPKMQSTEATLLSLYNANLD